MTGNEPGQTGENAQDENTHGDSASGDADAAENQQGNMIAAEDAAAATLREERTRRAEMGDQHAQAELADTRPTGADAPDRERPDRLWHAAEWLNGKLVPALGAAELGPYDEESAESMHSHDVCPLCGHPMAEHTIDRSTASAVLNCPAPQKPAPQSFEPLNEVGMVKHDRDDRR